MRWLAGLCLFASPLAAQTANVTCEDIDHLGASYSVCIASNEQDVQLFLKDGRGDTLGTFSAVENQEDRPFLFAMNAGMYHENRAPVGLYIEDGIEEMPAVLSAGPGNFGLLPNGVFCIDDRLRVFETLDYIARDPDCDYATQSGPMLVIDGKLHPRLIPNGTSRFIRNGVGTTADGNLAYFAISNEPVNFHDFATLFRDVFQVPNALYFDGNISRLYAPSLNRSDFGFGQLGPIVGVLDVAQ